MIVDELISTEDFEIEDYILITNVLYLDRIGRKMRRPHNRFDIPDSDYPCRIICDKLQMVFGLELDMISDISRNENYKNNIKNIFQLDRRCSVGQLRCYQYHYEEDQEGC